MKQVSIDKIKKVYSLTNYFNMNVEIGSLDYVYIITQDTFNVSFHFISFMAKGTSNIKFNQWIKL